MVKRFSFVALVFLSVTAYAEVPLDAGRADIAEGSVTLHGTSAPRARVRIYLEAGCEGDPIATTRAGRKGQFSVDISDAPQAPFAVSLRAEARGETSECLSGNITAPEAEAEVEAEAEAAPEPEPAPKSALGGMCMGLPTRCDLLPKGICYMQSGCGNPVYGDRCMGSARQCTSFNSKNACFMQRGCTWVKN